MTHLFNPITIEKTEQCRIVETLVDIRIVIGEWIFVLEKFPERKWVAVKKELVDKI